MSDEYMFNKTISISKWADLIPPLPVARKAPESGVAGLRGAGGSHPRFEHTDLHQQGRMADCQKFLFNFPG